MHANEDLCTFTITCKKSCVERLPAASGDCPADLSASVRALLDAGENHIVLPAGVYGPLDFNKSGVVIEMEPGVTIRLPDGSSTSADTIAKSALRISAPCCINGSFTVDGNKAGNDGSGLPTSQRAGALDIEANDVCLNGVVYVKDAYFRGLSVGGTVHVKNFNAAGFSHNPDVLRAPAGATHVELFYNQNAAVAPAHLGTGSNANTMFFSITYRRKA